MNNYFLPYSRFLVTLFTASALFLLFGACAKNTVKSSPQGNKVNLTLIDSIVIVAWLDPDFIQVKNGDTSGFLVDFINRFSEENYLNVSYRLFHNYSQALEAFIGKPNHLLFIPSSHSSLNADQFSFSLPILERNLSLTNALLRQLLIINYSNLFSNKQVVKNAFLTSLDGDDEKVLKVLTCFGVNTQDSLQLKRLGAYINRTENRADFAFLKHFYFKIQLPISMRRYRAPFAINGRVSPFDESFKKHATSFGVDWKLLAAISYKESRFNPIAIGAGGAYGLMQFMPFVARKYGIDGKSTPDEQIRAGCKLVFNSYRAWKSIPSEEQRIKFTLASYNAGQGHVLDAQRLAKKYGLNPQVWDDNVQLMVNNLSLAKYYKDSLVRSGPYHGHADQYANLVYQIYLSWKAI